jgi:hypothetical protein
MADHITDASTQRSKNLVRLGWLLLAICIVLTTAGLILLALNRPYIGKMDHPGYFSGVLIGLVYSTIGLVIIRYRPRLPFGWLFMALAVPSAIMSFCVMFAIYGFLVASDPTLIGVKLAAWLQIWVFYLVFPTPVAILFMLFPNGQLPSPNWRWVVWISILSTALLTIQALTTPGRILVYVTSPGIVLPMMNPTGIQRGFVLHSLENLWFFNVMTIPIGMSAILVRFRSSGWVERQQLKWLVYFLILLIILLMFAFLGNEIIENIGNALLILLLPVGTTLAILRYNLYGIDIIIRRTIQYALLTGILAAVYFSLVLILQSVFSNLSNRQSPLILVFSTLMIAALFNPLRLRILAFIDRRFFRSKYDAERILSDFAVAIQAEIDLENLSAVLLGIAYDTVQPARISLWLKQERLPKRKTTS